MAAHDFNDHRTGRKFGYGNWLQPIINANDTPMPDSEEPETTALEATRDTTPPRRGRGRPRMSKPRNESAVEKRRAQVREAQRSYQKRKDTATATEKHRVDELLQLLSDLSSDVESLLQVASTAGTMFADDDVSKHIQNLWSTYDTVVNNEHVQPELRLLQVKNTKRKALLQAKRGLHVEPVVFPQDQGGDGTLAPPFKTVFSIDPSDVNFDLVRFEGSTVLSSYQRNAQTDRYMAGRSIFDHVRERQAAMKEADQRGAEY
ncbi:hypothetical protein CC86DRAFT_386963 [Ophiobolus disseminans]|uniref:BZIP domain-containing protein n=1 Tax=Ophiobolus disseminans TaxID=1469910 RepID=A0A6A6ZJQ4_9PLEO|nr:hypothetical protein CC86DRAFT_386963 [Ophiobolus disseminans]